MREKKSFAKRTTTKTGDETRKKYFLVYEGEATEAIYFDAINDLKQEIGIDPLIELTPLIRSYSESGWSNPKKILDRVIQNITESQTGNMSYETLFNQVIDYLIEEGIIAEKGPQAKSIWEILQWYYEKESNKILTDTLSDLEQECKNISECLEKASCLATITADISDIIKNQKITYAEDFDKICLIVDRDRESFICNLTNDQYTYVLQTCREKNMGFYVTNPCFEFWILLHFDKVHRLDRTLLLENPKVSKKRRYTEDQLKKLIPDYRKSSYNARKLIKKIDTAIKNEKMFCESIEQLENTVGSNLGELIEEMRK
ncbi:RloB family protein [Acetobacterium sp.]|uniref:RloB family protein n=1 Tax=Acetobacterium sp. TaxID=1872094 RepID=UPI002F41A590